MQPRAGFEAEGPDSAAAMEHAYKFVLRYGSMLAVTLIIIWPLLALAAGSFSRSYFYFWVILSIVWGLVRAPLRAAAAEAPSQRGPCETHSLGLNTVAADAETGGWRLLPEAGAKCSPPARPAEALCARARRSRRLFARSCRSGSRARACGP